MYVTVGIGRAWIEGHYYINDTAFTFAPVEVPAGGSRYDRVMLRMDKSLPNRSITLMYRSGVASNDPVKPVPVREDDVYELVLADIYVTANASGVTVTDTRSDPNLCGWMYSTTGNGSFFQTLDNDFYEWFRGVRDEVASVTLFKRYSWSTTLEAQTSTVAFDITQYDPETCFVEVYVNGIFDNRHEVEDNVITFVGTLIAGTVITVNCYKSIDGTGIMSVADEITQLQNDVAQLDGVSKFTYKCTGLNDNIALSEIANAIMNGHFDSTSVSAPARNFINNLGGNEYLGNLFSDEIVTIEVSGNISVSTPFAGSGTDASPYKWFHMGENGTGESRKVVFDFSKCQKVIVICSANKTNTIFYGASVNIKNAQVQAFNSLGANCKITMIDCNGEKRNAVNAENCDFWVSASGSALIADHGTFTNCNCEVISEASTAYCFKPKSATFIRLFGGTYLAYGKTSTGISSAICHTSASDVDAVLMAYNIHCPTVNRENYTQGFLSVANAGTTYINGCVSRLSSSGDYNQIVGLVNRSKA